ncbi:Fis family transcriptional regulator [Sulfurimonas sp.]|nr:Fis family transcriptional regulator [Sulfurimonas sp.]
MVQGVVVTSFITLSNASKEAFKTATLLKTLNVNSLISGEDGVGKKSLAQYILPNASIIDAADFNECITLLENSTQVIISNLHNSPNFNTIIEIIQKNNVRVVATSKEYLISDDLTELFPVKFSIPPLEQREEDVKALIDMFSEEAAKLFGVDSQFDKFGFIPDLSDNSASLKRQVMINYLLQDIKDTELMDIIGNYLKDKLGSNSDYRNFLYLYEAPLIKEGLNQFKSQLQLADKLGLNRNTLRKKIADNKEYLK